jgi:ABC-type Mn2+/Zn2+ transport system permease subunit
MLLAPAASGALIARRLGSMMAVGIVIGSVSTYLGLLFSYTFNTAAGATIVLVATAIFFAILTAVNLRAGVRLRMVGVEDIEA